MVYETYTKRVLVACMGTSPAVLSETLYSLIADSADAFVFVPTEIVVVTTAVGRRRMEEKLLNPSGSWSPYDALSAQLIKLGRLHSPLPLPRIKVPIRVAGDDQAGEKIEDADAPADLDALADLLLPEVQTATSEAYSTMILDGEDQAGE